VNNQGVPVGPIRISKFPWDQVKFVLLNPRYQFVVQVVNISIEKQSMSGSHGARPMLRLPPPAPTKQTQRAKAGGEKRKGRGDWHNVKTVR